MSRRSNLLQAGTFFLRTEPTVYPVSDDDLERLESFLDDALSDEETQALRQRLAVEANLAAALRQLRGERSQRQAFFQSIDPAPPEVEQLVGAIHRAARQRSGRLQRLRLVRSGSALAACAALGLAVGLLYRGGAERPVAPRGPQVASTSVPLATDRDQTFAVEVTDDTGHVIAVQHFDNAGEANDFASDLRRVQASRRQPGHGVMLIGDEF
jgi:anti-sigma factor RsiW